MPYHVVAVLSYYLLLGVYMYIPTQSESKKRLEYFLWEIAQVTSQL